MAPGLHKVQSLFQRDMVIITLIFLSTKYMATTVVVTVHFIISLFSAWETM